MSEARARLLEHGLHFTAQRAALFQALYATRSHPTAEELYHLVRPRTRSLSLATVSSTLETFCRVGLVRKVPTPEGACRYDAAAGAHVHLCESRSGAIRDLPEELGARLLGSIPRSVLAEIEQQLHVRIEGVDVQLRVRTAEPPAARPTAPPTAQPTALAVDR